MSASSSANGSMEISAPGSPEKEQPLQSPSSKHKAHVKPRVFSMLVGAMFCIAYSLLIPRKLLIPRELDCILDQQEPQQNQQAIVFQSQAEAVVAQSRGSSNTTTPAITATENGRIIFGIHPTNFVEGFANCMEDETCHIIYHHVQKTGGTFIASTFYPLLNNKDYSSGFWCCHDKFMKRFRANPEKYCNLKLGVYEVVGDQLKEVVDTCQKVYAEQNHHAITFATVRDPVQRTVSWIHQQCNKNYDRMKEFQPVCDRCSYYEDQEMWDIFVEREINVYLQLSYSLPLDIYTIEDVMIDQFLALLETRLNRQLPAGHPNAEKKQICDFHVPTVLFKKFNNARRVYRELLTGTNINKTALERR